MKFIYEYRTSDNAKHRAVVSAVSREAAFAALKEKGIRPSSVVEAPGFFNKLFGKYKRWLAIAVLLTAVFGLVVALMRSESPGGPDDVVYATADGRANPIERRQIWGDAAVIEQAAGTHWRMLFRNPAERLLALFAQPGYLLKDFPPVPESIHADFDAALESRLVIHPSDLDEYKQMKCIVEGMKDELRAYIKEGGTLDGYLKRLVRRQREESDFIERAKKELDGRIERGEDGFAAWQEINRLLREQGLKSIPLPSL